MSKKSPVLMSEYEAITKIANQKPEIKAQVVDTYLSQFETKKTMNIFTNEWNIVQRTIDKILKSDDIDTLKHNLSVLKWIVEQCSVIRSEVHRILGVIAL